MLLLIRRCKRRRKRSSWVRKIFESRQTMGEYHALIAEMRLSDHEIGHHSSLFGICNSAFGQAMEADELSLPEAEVLPGSDSPVPYVFVGDAAFPLKTYMLRPYPGRFLTEGKRIFNYRLSRARRIIENTFGIMASKFRIFRRAIIANPEKMTKVTKAACCLHNYLKISEACCPSSQRHYCPPGYLGRETQDGNIVPGDWRSQTADGIQDIRRMGSNTFSRSAAELRTTMTEYFTSEYGSVPWQINHVRSCGI